LLPPLALLFGPLAFLDFTTSLLECVLVFGHSRLSQLEPGAVNVGAQILRRDIKKSKRAPILIAATMRVKPTSGQLQSGPTAGAARLIAAASSAAIATAPAATASAATTAAAAATAIFTRASFVYCQGATVVFLQVQPLDGGLRFCVATHFDEPKAFAPARVSIHDHFGTLNRAEFGEQLLQLRTGGAVAEISAIQFLSHRKHLLWSGSGTARRLTFGAGQKGPERKPTGGGTGEIGMRSGGPKQPAAKDVSSHQPA
jgi:hypothetical protein